jgi:antitoxin CptB
MNRLERDRLKWQCRRGLLELDLVLERFFLKNQNLEKDILLPLGEILEFPDNDLWDIVIGRSDQYQPHLSEIVARLRAA